MVRICTMVRQGPSIVAPCAGDAKHVFGADPKQEVKRAYCS